ncbi:hypothetical protein FQN53_000366 [Emmonsiellopsis sp. PD_33]|nr:hypothetical protein FQN53_000366 [Emmonsiellopsis sp. PD_33]
MSLAVKHLNADTTFLLTLSPNRDDISTEEKIRGPKKAIPFTILIDPWLTGRTVIGHRWFATSEHTVQPCISHLSELDREPDLVIVSQSKPDHCHEPTLRQLPRDSPRTKVLAEPKAAKTIRKLGYFRKTKVVAIPEYNPRNPDSILRFHIDPLAENGEVGEVTVVLIPERDTTGLHNAIGITYRAPTASSNCTTLCPGDLPLRNNPTKGEIQPTRGLLEKRKDADQHLPSISILDQTSPFPISNPPSNFRSSLISKLALSPRPRIAGQNQHKTAARESRLLSLPHSPTASTPTIPLFSAASPTSVDNKQATITSALSSPASDLTLQEPAIPTASTPQAPPREIATVSNLAPKQVPPVPRVHPPISILYTPHGIRSTPLDKYASHHLHIQPLTATKTTPSINRLTLLIHSFDRVQNPWYLGGNIIAGANGGGVALAKKLRPKCWIGAHDEDKVNGGISVKLLKTEKELVEDIRKMVVEGGIECDVRDLGVGEEVVLGG